MLFIQDCSGKFLQNLIEDILDLCRMEYNHFNLTMSEFGIKELIQEVFSIVSYHANAKDIQLKFKISSQVSTKIQSDMKRLKQVLINLVTNALKFTQ
jgi:two-component system CheB/CheR fusion protein